VLFLDYDIYGAKIKRVMFLGLGKNLNSVIIQTKSTALFLTIAVASAHMIFITQLGCRQENLYLNMKGQFVHFT
jgi:hypothetical protein